MVAKKVVATKGAVQDFLLHCHFLLRQRMAKANAFKSHVSWLNNLAEGNMPRRDPLSHLQLSREHVLQPYSNVGSSNVVWKETAPLSWNILKHHWIIRHSNHLGFGSREQREQSMSFPQRKSLLLYKLVARSPYTHSQHFTTRFHL